jgi:hypothetical protein
MPGRGPDMTDDIILVKSLQLLSKLALPEFTYIIVPLKSRSVRIFPLNAIGE